VGGKEAHTLQVNQSYNFSCYFYLYNCEDKDIIKTTLRDLLIALTKGHSSYSLVMSSGVKFKSWLVKEEQVHGHSRV
jgi:hypothetical protein